MLWCNKQGPECASVVVLASQAPEVKEITFSFTIHSQASCWSNKNNQKSNNIPKTPQTKKSNKDKGQRFIKEKTDFFSWTDTHMYMHTHALTHPNKSFVYTWYHAQR